MTENVENLILERLCRIDQHLQDLRGDVQDMKIRLTAVEEQLSGIHTSIVGVNSRMDRFGERLGRVERWLELSEAR